MHNFISSLWVITGVIIIIIIFGFLSGSDHRRERIWSTGAVGSGRRPTKLRQHRKKLLLLCFIFTYSKNEIYIYILYKNIKKFLLISSAFIFLFQVSKVNLIITDYSMPGMTGYELLKKIKVIMQLFQHKYCITGSLFNYEIHD